MVNKRQGPTAEQIALLGQVAENMPLLAKAQPTRALGRYHQSGGERYLTIWGFMEQVAHKKGLARFEHAHDRHSIVRCLINTYGLSRQQVYAFYYAAQAVHGLERRADVMEAHSRRVHAKLEAELEAA